MSRLSASAFRRQILRVRALALRSAPTGSEAALWRLVRAQQLGVRFRRQVPLGVYIADFVAPSAPLVVEVDGGCHAARAHLDARRDRALERLGYRVLRLSDRLVLECPAAALSQMRAGLRE
jgi:very-short-patch-repair endonuclease